MLSSYLESIAAFNKAVMVRKGREVAKDVVEVKAAKNLLDDKFQMVPGIKVTGSRVVARETLVCNGAGNCERLCGGLGRCIEGCDKTTKRAKEGHRCSFKVKMSMRVETVGMWQVEVEGQHVPVIVERRPPKKNLLKTTEMKKRLKDVDIQATTAKKLALQVVGTHWSLSGHALLNRTVFGAACQPNKRQFENYLYRQRKKVHKAVSLVPYADSDSDNDDGDGTTYGLV